MNETRKQIIELIEPYMDKTLSLGCYVTIPWYKREEWICIISDYSSDEWLYAFIWWKSMELYPINDIKPDKILWHYDISAVLKYIEDRKHNFRNWKKDFLNPKFNTEVNKDVWYVESDHQDMWEFINGIEFPLKPLHLYTEQEEKDLLELLKELWTT